MNNNLQTIVYSKLTLRRRTTFSSLSSKLESQNSKFLSCGEVDRITICILLIFRTSFKVITSINRIRLSNHKQMREVHYMLRIYNEIFEVWEKGDYYTETQGN